MHGGDLLRRASTEARARAQGYDARYSKGTPRAASFVPIYFDIRATGRRET
jgi:hypothetical protein